MKSTIKESPVPEPEITYPCLLKHKIREFIILVSERNNVAIVVHAGEGWRLGEDYGCLDDDESENFELFEGEVSLSN